MKFKDGDKVYVPKVSTEVLVVYCADEGDYPVVVGDKTFTTCGRQYQHDDVPSLIYATQENRELLEKLYGVEFEAPIEFVDVRLPLTFKPKIGDTYWIIEPYSDLGYGCSMYDVGRRSDKKAVENGVWRTEEEVKQVANAIFKLNKD